MKRKQTAISLIVLVCAGIGMYALFKMHGTAPEVEEEEQNVPTVVGVQVGALERMTLRRYVNGYGTVEPAPATASEPAADAPLAASTAGVVADVNVAEGQHVRKGEVLITLNAGTATAKYAEQEVARQRKLYAQHNTSLKNLQDAEARLVLLQVTAPLSGTVTRVNVKPGAAVDVNTVVAEVMDLRRLVVKTDGPTSQAGELQPGQEVQVLTQPPVATALSFVSPTVDPSNGTVLARALLPADSGLRPGQFLALRIVTAVHPNCLAAPEESVVTDATGHSIISLVKDDAAVHTPVRTGFRENGWVEIEGTGLKAGDAVVTVGAYGLPDKTKIQVVSSPADETPAKRSSLPSAQ